MTHIEQLIQDMCPHGVEFKKLGEVTRTLPKGTLKTTDLTEEGFPVINSGKSLYGYYSEYNNDCQAVTIAARGEYAGWISYFNEKFWAGGLCYPYTSKDEKVLMTRFLYFWLKREEGIIMDTLVARGSIPALNKSDLDQLEIPIPPMAIQEKIVTILDEFSALAAELQAELQMRRKQYEYYRTQLLTPHSESNSADKSNDCNWDFKPLGEICDLVKDRISASELDEDTYVSVENLLSNKLGKIPSMSVPTIGNVINYHKDNVLIGNIRPYLRKIWLADNEGGTNGDVITLGIKGKYRDMILPRFLYHALADERFFIYDTQYSSGAKMPRGDKDKVMEYQIAIPSIKKQAELVEFLDKLDKLTTSLEEGIPAEQIRQQKRYEYYRDLLLTFPRKTV